MRIIQTARELVKHPITTLLIPQAINYFPIVSNESKTAITLTYTVTQTCFAAK